MAVQRMAALVCGYDVTTTVGRLISDTPRGLSFFRFVAVITKRLTFTVVYTVFTTPHTRDNGGTNGGRGGDQLRVLWGPTRRRSSSSSSRSSSRSHTRAERRHIRQTQQERRAVLALAVIGQDVLRQQPVTAAAAHRHDVFQLDQPAEMITHLVDAQRQRLAHHAPREADRLARPRLRARLRAHPRIESQQQRPRLRCQLVQRTPQHRSS